VRRPDRSIGGMRRQGPVDRFDEAVGEDARIQPGSFTQDPGMRAQAGQFTDVTSRDYGRHYGAHAERGGALEFATSVGAERDAERDTLIMEIVGMVLATMAGAKMGSSPIPEGTRASLAQRKLLPPEHISERIYGGVLGGIGSGFGAGVIGPTSRGKIMEGMDSFEELLQRIPAKPGSYANPRQWQRLGDDVVSPRQWQRFGPYDG